MVEYQCGVSDMIQSIEAKVWVSARTMMEGPARRRRRADTLVIPRHVLTARAAVVEDGDEGPDPEVERRPDQEERHVEVWRLPAKQRILRRLPRRGTIRRDRAGRAAPAGTGPPSREAWQKIVSPIRRSTIPHPPWAAYWISTKKSAPRARLKKNRNDTSHEKKNCLGFAAPRIAQATTPSRAQTAAMTGMRFHEVPRRDRGLLGPQRYAIVFGDHSGLQELDASCAQGLQQRPGGRRIEPGIPRFDRDEEGVVGRPLEDLGLEERMVVHREPVQAEHAEDGAERAEEDCDLEGDRNEGRPGEKRLAANHEGVGAGVDPPLQDEPERGPRQSHDEDDPGKHGASEPHRLAEAVDGERAVGVPPGEARVTHPLARVIEVRRRREFGEDSVVRPLREPREQRHLEAPSGARLRAA